MARSPATPKRSSPNPLYAALGVLALLAVGYYVYQSFGKGTPATRPVELEISQEELARVQGISMGPEDAPVVMYEFADFQCPACGQFASLYAPLIKQRLVDEGLVRYVYYDFPLTSIHPHAFLAARAGRCANEQERFWPFHDLVYARQPSWSTLRDATPYFVDLAEEAGLDQSAFESCLRSDRYADEVTRSLRLGESLGVQGTPTLFVNGKRLPSVPSFSELEQMVREEAGVAPDTATASE